MSLTGCGKTYFSLFSTPMVLEHLFECFSTWLFQFRCSSIIRPRKLNTYTLSIEISSICISKGYDILFPALNSMYFDLFTFKDNLFTILSHSSIPHHYLFNLHSNSTFSFGLADRGIVHDRVVSSAYIMKLNSRLAFGKSLMYIW